MKKRFVVLYLLVVFLCISAFPGCAEADVTTHNNRNCVEQVGDIPAEFRKVIENNLFSDITAFDGRLLKAEILSEDKENRSVTQKVHMMDLYGNDLAAYTCSSDDAYHVTTLTATNDGGFLFVLGFSDYAYGQNTWASDKGFASRVIKCDKDGKLQFDTSFDGVEGDALRFCFEKNGQFYLFGEMQTPETKQRGVHSRTDIYMVLLDESGAVLKAQTIAGSDYDNLVAAEPSGDSFILSVSSQSDDGDFEGSDSNGYPKAWVIRVNDSLEIVQKKKETGRDYFDYRLGEKNGTAIYESHRLLWGFDAGSPQAFIDYGNFYLIVSTHNTGIYENTPPMISATWYYRETVYSAYRYNGDLLFRASVDSSPDFDAWVSGMQPF